MRDVCSATKVGGETGSVGGDGRLNGGSAVGPRALPGGLVTLAVIGGPWADPPPPDDHANRGT
jgi:hypothetical protein